MSNQKYRSELRKLQDVWYKKLAESGFNDLEQEDGKLKSWSSKITYKPALIWETQSAYYRMAENFLRDYEFKKELDKVIWEYHTNGLSIREIVKTINDLKVLHTHRDGVFLVLKRLTEAMKRMYVAE